MKQRASYAFAYTLITYRKHRDDCSLLLRFFVNPTRAVVPVMETVESVYGTPVVFQMRLEVAAAVGLLLTTTVTAYQIFAFEPSPGHSHWNVMSTALESLLDAGHVVVCVTMHRATGRLAGNPNYTHIDASKSMGESLINLNYSDLMRLSENLTRMAMHVEQLSCNALTELSDVRDLLLDDGRPRFDVVFLDSMYSECSKALFSRLGLPVAYVIPCPLGDWITPTVFGSAGHMSYVQHALHVVPPVPKTFGQRVAIAVHYVYTNLVRWRLDVDYSSYPEPRNSIVFINTHYSLEPVAPMGLEVHEIGGIHLRPPKPLPRVSSRSRCPKLRRFRRL